MICYEYWSLPVRLSNPLMRQWFFDNLVWEQRRRRLGVITVRELTRVKSAWRAKLLSLWQIGLWTRCAASVWLSKSGCTAWIGLKKCHLWQAGSSKKTACWCRKPPPANTILALGASSHLGAMWLTPVITSGPCGQIPPHRVAFIVFFFFFPSSKLTPVTDWLDDLSIDLPDPSRALPSDAPDGRSFHRSLRRILSCISQDKQALIAKGKARRNRGVSPPPQNKHRSMAELSEQTYLILTSVSVEAMHAVCASLMLYALADTRGTIK